VELPITLARIFSEFDFVLLLTAKELSEAIKDKSSLLLEYVQRRVKDLFCHMNGVHDNNDFGYVLEMDCLINAASDSKEFSFSASDVDCMVKGFDDWPIVNMNMCYRRCDVVLDTGVCDRECIGWSIRRFNC